MDLLENILPKTLTVQPSPTHSQAMNPRPRNQNPLLLPTFQNPILNILDSGEGRAGPTTGDTSRSSWPPSGTREKCPRVAMTMMSQRVGLGVQRGQRVDEDEQEREGDSGGLLAFREREKPTQFIRPTARPRILRASGDARATLQDSHSRLALRTLGVYSGLKREY